MDPLGITNPNFMHHGIPKEITIPFVLFDNPYIGNLITPVIVPRFQTQQQVLSPLKHVLWHQFQDMYLHRPVHVGLVLKYLNTNTR